MGVRVASFRGAQETLERGQQQIGRFFQTGTNTSGQLGVAPTSASSNIPDIQDNSRPRGPTAVDDLNVVEICDTDEEVETVPSKSCKADAVEETVDCPVCGKCVSIADAEAHVNAHYDGPNVQVERKPYVESATKDNHVVERKKRKASQTAGNGMG